jgi:chromosome segregation ATPase
MKIVSGRRGGNLGLVAIQAAPSIQREGLPFWIFWFLLCFILLLVFFIFLRDKRLRMRLSAFLAGARRRSVLLQLKFKLKRERQGKATVLIKLGEKAWDEDVRVPGSETLHAQLRDLLEERDDAQEEWKNTLAELERWHVRLEETVALFKKKRDVEAALKKPFDDLMKQKRDEEKALKRLARDREIERQIDEIRRDRDETRKKINEHTAAIKAIEAEGSGRRREIEKEIRIWARKKERIQERIKVFGAEQQELYLMLGRLIEEKRSDSRALAPLYEQLDAVNSRIATLLHRIDTLSGGNKTLLPPGLR